MMKISNVNEFNDDTSPIDVEKQEQAIQYLWWKVHDKSYDYDCATHEELHYKLTQALSPYKFLWAKVVKTSFEYACLSGQRFLEGEPTLKQSSIKKDYEEMWNIKL